MKGFPRYIHFVFLIGTWTLPMVATAQIQWLSWEEAQALNAREPRKFLVDIYTHWCGWCKKMDKATFEQPRISEYVNQNYYAVKFDAETKSEIQFKDRVFKFVRSGANGYHELAAELTFGKLSYPTIVFLDEKMDVIQPIPGFKDPAALDKIMKYFAEDYFKTMPWKKFEEMYQHQLQHPGHPAPPPQPKRD